MRHLHRFSGCLPRSAITHPFSPDIVNIEFLGESAMLVGMRFRETRLMNGKNSVTELEVTEYAENKNIRMVADSHGTVWDTIFEVVENGAATDFVLTMEARAYRLLPKIINPLFKGLYKKGLVRHVDALNCIARKRDGVTVVSAVEHFHNT